MRRREKMHRAAPGNRGIGTVKTSTPHHPLCTNSLLVALPDMWIRVVRAACLWEVYLRRTESGAPVIFQEVVHSI